MNGFSDEFIVVVFDFCGYGKLIFFKCDFLIGFFERDVDDVVGLMNVFGKLGIFIWFNLFFLFVKCERYYWKIFLKVFY